MARGEVTIRVKIPPPNLAVTAWMNEAGPVITGGYGGWDVVARPRRVALTQWNGREPYQMDLGIIMDGFRSDDSVEADITALERMALPYNTEPVPVLVLGTAVPHGGTDTDWIINQIVWGTALRNSDSLRVRQEATVTLVSYVAVDRLQLRAAKQARKKVGKP